MNTIAIDIKPELMIIEETINSPASYRLDSGIEDFNRVVASDTLDTLNFIDIPIHGFDTFLYFEDLAGVSEFIKMVKNSEELIDIAPYSKPIADKSAIIVIHGQVSIALSNNDGKTVELCRPIYQITPDKKTGDLIAIQDIRSYVSKKWIEECKEALFHTGVPAGQRFGVVKRLRESENLQLKLLGLILAFATTIIIIIALGGLFSGFQSQPQTQSASAANGFSGANTLLNANNLPQDQLLQIQANAAHPANAVYGNGMTGAEGEATVEDFARLQVEQTQNMLKEMGIDVNDKKADIGCFTGGDS